MPVQEKAIRIFVTLVCFAGISDFLRIHFSPNQEPIANLTDLRIHVNEDPPQKLGLLSGIGPVIANRILEQRSYDYFLSPDDFESRVKGIGPSFMMNSGSWLSYETSAPKRAPAFKSPGTEPTRERFTP